MKIVALMISVFLVSCSTTPNLGQSTTPNPVEVVRGNIESFNNFGVSLDGLIYVEAGSEIKKGMLEFASYKNKLENNLMNKGFQFADELSTANYVLFLDYGIGNEKIRIGSYSVPTYGPTGGGTTTFFGDTAYTTPNYGLTGLRTQNYSYSEYPRFVTLDIFKKDSQEKVYEMTLKSSGTCGQMSEVIDEFFEAISRDFPNNSGPFEVSGIFNC